jgi:hypothetical protein
LIVLCIPVAAYVEVMFTKKKRKKILERDRKRDIL